jgi:deoxyribonuclease-4
VKATGDATTQAHVRGNFKLVCRTSIGHLVRKKRIKKETAEKIGEEAKKRGILMSVHAPYYINLANSSPEKRAKSRKYILNTYEVAKNMKAKRVVLHTGSAKGKNRKEAVQTVISELKTIREEIIELNLEDIILCPETLGKVNQLGSLEEILHICEADDMLLPTIDFGHLNSRGNGCIKTQADYAAILDAIENSLGKERMDKMHVHFSHQEYTQAGEKRHLTFEDTEYGPFFPPLSKEIVKRNMHPVIVCESRDVMAKDALTMKKIYEQDLLR